MKKHINVDFTFELDEQGIEVDVSALLDYEMEYSYGSDIDGNRGINTWQGEITDIQIMHGNEDVTKMVETLNKDDFKRILKRVFTLAENKL
jgi:hypothetical protein